MSPDGTRVLVADGDLDRLDRYAAWIPDEWSVDRATDGEAALAVVSRSTDVVVLGGDLPDMEADAVCRRLHNRGYECQVVRVIDGEPDFEVAQSAADDLLVAPVEEATFRDCIRRVGDRVTYDERVREYFSLASKKAVLEARKSPDQLAGSDEYARLQERTLLLGRRVDEMRSDLSDDGYERMFEGFFPGTAAPQ